MAVEDIKDFAIWEIFPDSPQNNFGGAYTLCELRRFLGGATHFASFHEALAEQSAPFALVSKLPDTNCLIITDCVRGV